jgi:hypothetical protein
MGSQSRKERKYSKVKKYYSVTFFKTSLKTFATHSVSLKAEKLDYIPAIINPGNYENKAAENDVYTVDWFDNLTSATNYFNFYTRGIKGTVNAGNNSFTFFYDEYLI